LRRLEETLKFPQGALVMRAHLARTPEDVRGVIQNLLGRSRRAESPGQGNEPSRGFGISLDEAYLTGALQAIVEERSGNAELVRMGCVPVVNKVSAGYPRDFTDMGYPARVADEYVPAPGPTDPADRDRFAARVHGDSMSPEYREGDVVVFSAVAEPKSGDDCFVRLDDGRTTFKRAFFEKDSANRDVVRLEPLNKRYDTRTVLAERVAGVYRAVWVSRAVG
jgi:phage repressor protein C with HTH and peptisase S24 domain